MPMRIYTLVDWIQETKSEQGFVLLFKMVNFFLFIFYVSLYTYLCIFQIFYEFTKIHGPIVADDFVDFSLGAL